MHNKIKILPKDFAGKRNEIAKKVGAYWAKDRHQRLADIEHKRELKRIEADHNFDLN